MGVLRIGIEVSFALPAISGKWQLQSRSLIVYVIEVDSAVLADLPAAQGGHACAMSEVRVLVA